jgi:LemA protein
MIIFIFVILAVIAALVAVLYNTLVKLRNKANEAWSDIDTQLKRRYDLIPNIVETVKGYASHEAGTLEKVTQARTAAMNATSMQDREKAENVLSGTLKSIFALSEQYPDLKANQNFLDLQKTLKEVEDQLQMSRRYYNATVRDFNNQIQVFPSNLIAPKLGFTAKEFFQATDEEKKNVQVSFAQQMTQGLKSVGDTAKGAAAGVTSVAAAAKNTTSTAVSSVKQGASAVKDSATSIKNTVAPAKPVEAPKPEEKKPEPPVTPPVSPAAPTPPATPPAA